VLGQALGPALTKNGIALVSSAAAHNINGLIIYLLVALASRYSFAPVMLKYLTSSSFVVYALEHPAL
jgi:hypothetical protein